MRRIRTRVFLGLATFVGTLGLSLFAAPTPAHATECYTIWIGPQGTTICPWS